MFPKLGVGVFPKRGRAIFWYNLHHDGTGDERTLHGACPVLLGSKWGKYSANTISRGIVV